ncbi:hypothetical protein ACN4EG_10020 [Alkalinema pantanalense CENA528]|uniref:hypothetical protein n=1 Tax=Alkalinema pantanalense TaxID=1620705 RepID=UPI003D70187F
MQTTTIQLPDPLLQSLQNLAQKTGTPFDQLIQTAIETYLQQHTPLPPSIGSGNSGLTTLSEQTHDRLWQDLSH